MCVITSQVTTCSLAASANTNLLHNSTKWSARRFALSPSPIFFFLCSLDIFIWLCSFAHSQSVGSEWQNAVYKWLHMYTCTHRFIACVCLSVYITYKMTMISFLLFRLLHLLAMLSYDHQNWIIPKSQQGWNSFICIHRIWSSNEPSWRYANIHSFHWCVYIYFIKYINRYDSFIHVLWVIKELKLLLFFFGVSR